MDDNANKSFDMIVVDGVFHHLGHPVHTIKCGLSPIFFSAPLWDSDKRVINISYNAQPIMFYTKLKLPNITDGDTNLFIIDDDWITKNGSNSLLIEGEIHVNLIIGAIYSEITFTSTTKNRKGYTI
jgi:hypothetical protein